MSTGTPREGPPWFESGCSGQRCSRRPQPNPVTTRSMMADHVAAEAGSNQVLNKDFIDNRLSHRFYRNGLFSVKSAAKSFHLQNLSSRLDCYLLRQPTAGDCARCGDRRRFIPSAKRNRMKLISKPVWHSVRRPRSFITCPGVLAFCILRRDSSRAAANLNVSRADRSTRFAPNLADHRAKRHTVLFLRGLAFLPVSPC